jgi:N-carbamoylputrescine amidase
MIRTALIQNKYSDSLVENRRKNAICITKAARRGADLIVLPELHDSLYFCQTEDASCFDLAHTIPGPATDFYSALAKKNNVVLVTSNFEKRAKGLYHNTAVVFEKNGRIAGKYRKMHIPDDPGYYEKFYFAPGDLGFTPIRTSVGNLGVMVCWDQWYPEAARMMALAGADLLIYPTAIGWNSKDTKEEQERQLAAWTIIQRSHAVANGIHTIAVNRTGFEKSPDKRGSGIDFWGSSFIAGCQGEIIACAGSGAEAILVAEIDIDRTDKVRRLWPFLRDRRIDSYKDIDKRFRDK